MQIMYSATLLQQDGIYAMSGRGWKEDVDQVMYWVTLKDMTTSEEHCLVGCIREREN